MEVSLSPLETLTDRLLSDAAAKAQDEIRSIQSAHHANVSTFVAAVAERAGVKIPQTFRRITEPSGQVKLIWDEPTPAPAPVDPHAPALGP